MEELKINGVIYAFNVHQREPSLPYLLMLHGFMGDSRVFQPLIEDLCETSNPITVDLLGHGQTEKPTEEQRYGESHQINDILTIVQHIALGPLYLYGYSMGGRLALKTAIKAPELFEGFIFESTNPGIFDDDKRAERRKTDAARAQQIRQNYQEFLANWEELALFQSPIPIDEEQSGKYKTIHLEQDPDAMAASIIGFGTGAMEPLDISKISFQNPVLLVAGSGDKKYIKISENLAFAFDNCHVSHLEAGHRVHLDNPKELARKINSFIQQNALS